MEVLKTAIEGLLIIDPTVFGDRRGYFFESYNEEEFKKNGIPNKFVQEELDKMW